MFPRVCFSNFRALELRRFSYLSVLLCSVFSLLLWSLHDAAAGSGNGSRVVDDGGVDEEEESPRSQQPNIVFILADDLGESH